MRVLLSVVGMTVANFAGALFTDRDWKQAAKLSWFQAVAALITVAVTR